MTLFPIFLVNVMSLFKVELYLFCLRTFYAEHKSVCSKCDKLQHVCEKKKNPCRSFFFFLRKKQCFESKQINYFIYLGSWMRKSLEKRWGEKTVCIIKIVMRHVLEYLVQWPVFWYLKKKNLIYFQEKLLQDGDVQLRQVTYIQLVFNIFISLKPIASENRIRLQNIKHSILLFVELVLERHRRSSAFLTVNQPETNVFY